MNEKIRCDATEVVSLAKRRDSNAHVASRLHDCCRTCDKRDGASNGGNLITHGVIKLNSHPRYESECQAALFRATDYSDWFRTPRARRSCKTAREKSRARDLIQHFRKEQLIIF